jgi:hypothetical protein
MTSLCHCFWHSDDNYFDGWTLKGKQGYMSVPAFEKKVLYSGNENESKMIRLDLIQRKHSWCRNGEGLSGSEIMYLGEL